MQYGLFSYTTENIGDEIQSIAARRFLPKVDAYVDRDEVGRWNPEERTKIIMNAWYMHPPYSWPPKNANIDPLLVSMYVDQKDEHVAEAFFSEESKQYLKVHGPVGARDISTMKFLQNHGINAYFSGCMTLTLQRDPDIQKQDFVLAVDVPPEVVRLIREKTNRPVVEASPYFDAAIELTDRFQLAEYFLYLYQSAHTVITTRLHAMLPSLALETPVLLIKDHEKYEPKRYAGLDELVHSLTDTQYVENYALYDVDNPPDNPKDYKSLREKLIQDVSAFTRYNNTKTFRTVDFTKLASNGAYIRLFTKGFHSLNKALLLQGDKSWLQEQNADLHDVLDKTRISYQEKITRYEQSLNEQDKQIKLYQDELETIKTSRSFRIGLAMTSPIRWIKKLLAKER